MHAYYAPSKQGRVPKPPSSSNHAWDTQRERERELRTEGREVPSRVRLREGPIGVRITLGQPTIG